MTPDCPLCDLTFEDWDLLAHHLVRSHGDLVVNHNHLYRNGKGNVRCWCLAWFTMGVNPADAFRGYADESRFARHLRRRGGVAKHILELTFNLERRTP